MPKILIAYIPVLHKGYLQFLQNNGDVDRVYVVSPELLAQFPHIRKDIRSLEPEMMKELLSFLSLGAKVELLTESMALHIVQSEVDIIMPDEDIMHELAAKYFPDSQVTYQSVFLRWDKKRTLAEKEVEASEHLSREKFDQQMMQLAYDQAAKSADWWRHVGAVLVKEGKVLLTAYNHHVPHEQQPYFDGDPRGNFKGGQQIELSTAMHAEADIICQAAKQGISTKGCTLYVSTFPCPVCAKLIAYSGITTVYFCEGYTRVDGAEVLQENKVALIKVELPNGESYV